MSLSTTRFRISASPSERQCQVLSKFGSPLDLLPIRSFDVFVVRQFSTKVSVCHQLMLIHQPSRPTFLPLLFGTLCDLGFEFTFQYILRLSMERLLRMELMPRSTLNDQSPEQFCQNRRSLARSFRSNSNLHE